MTYINNLDEKIYELIMKFESITTTKIMLTISYFASTITLIGLSIVLLIILKERKYSRLIAINLGISFVLNRLLKIIIRRPRPPRIPILPESGYSFPSGHAMICTAYYGFLIYLIYKNVKNKKIKYPLIVMISLIVLSVGISRVYLGVHYVTDVLGGIIIGIVYLIIGIKYLQNKKVLP